MVAHALQRLLMASLLVLVLGSQPWWWPALRAYWHAQISMHLSVRGWEGILPQRVYWQEQNLLLEEMQLGDGLRIDRAILTFTYPWQRDFWQRPLPHLRIEGLQVRLRQSADGQWEWAGGGVPGRPQPSVPETSVLETAVPGGAASAPVNPSGQVNPSGKTWHWTDRLHFWSLLPTVEIVESHLVLEMPAGMAALQLEQVRWQPQPFFAEPVPRIAFDAAWRGQSTWSVPTVAGSGPSPVLPTPVVTRPVDESSASAQLTVDGAGRGAWTADHGWQFWLDPALLLTLEGGMAQGQWRQPAVFRVSGLEDRPVWQQGPQGNTGGVQIQSHGPRLDGHWQGIRMVARRDAVRLTVEVDSLPATRDTRLQLRLEVREWLFPEQFVAVGDARLHATWQTTTDGPATGVLSNLQFRVGQVTDQAVQPRFPTLGIHMDLGQAEQRVRGRGELRIGTSATQTIPIALRLDAAADGHAGWLAWQNPDLVFGGAGHALRPLVPQANAWVSDFLGRIRLDGQLAWDTSREQERTLWLDTRLDLREFQVALTPRPWLQDGTIQVIGGHIVTHLTGDPRHPQNLALTTHLDAITLLSPQATVYGLEGLNLQLQPLWPPHTERPWRLNFDELGGFLPFERGEMQLRLQQGRILELQALQMHLGDGRVSARPLQIHLGRPEGVLRLDVSGVQLSRLNERLQIDLRNSLEVDGILDGELPIYFSPDQVRLLGARLAARSPGILRYRPGDPADWRNKTGKSTLQLALSNYRFEQFQVQLQGELGEAVTIDLHTVGSNRDILWGMPVDLKLKIHASLAQLLSAYSGSVGHAERTIMVLD
jgi:hypothetical protein